MTKQHEHTNYVASVGRRPMTGKEININGYVLWITFWEVVITSETIVDAGLVDAIKEARGLLPAFRAECEQLHRYKKPVHSLPFALRSRILKRDNYTCQGCGVKLTESILTIADFHIHHIQSRHMGGTDDPSNLQVLCKHYHYQAHR